MRVISGRLGGRLFKSPGTSLTHPMSERMRGALFNTLGDIEGLTVLDCFGGSGALSIEALSRGAKSSVITEIDRTAFNTINQNMKDLDLGNVAKPIQANVSTWSDNNSSAKFDLVLCNPPFDKINLKVIQKLTRHVSPNGTFVLCWPAKENSPKLPGLDLAAVKEKDYGDACLTFYKQA